MRHCLSHLAFLLFTSLRPSAIEAASRTFTITNSCSETIWTAITNFGEHQTYTGSHGFEQRPGNVTEVTIPSPWNGRVWPRRKCSFDAQGKGKCVTGDCDGLLECKDGTIGTVNVGEFNLDSWEGKDFWDQSCVPGWTVPMLIAPQGNGCESVSCTKDVNAACPDERMKVKDDEGNTLACIAACFAKINATEPSMNCCSGKYNDLAACVSDQVDYYSVLKPLCENAYWYPYDSRPGSPTVDFACPSSGDPGYKIEYCPDASSTSDGEGESPSSRSEGGSAGATGTGGSATSAGEEKPSSSSSRNSKPLSTTASSASSAASSTTPTSSPTVAELPLPAIFAGLAAIFLALFLLVACLFMRRHHGQALPVSRRGRHSETSSSSSGGDTSDSGEEESDGEGGRERKEESLAVPSRPLDALAKLSSPFSRSSRREAREKWQRKGRAR